jgi:dTDP-4-dehydrorhamnose reductase
VLRTSWVYGPVGRNFCLTMLRLHQQRAAADEPLAVVADQVGCPTATTGAHGLAAACWRLIAKVEGAAAAAADPLPSILHWSDAGAASWFDFALAIGELGQAAGLLPQAAEVVPITTAQYPTPAQRPGYSLLDCTATRTALGLQPLPWRVALAQVLAELAARG